MLIMTTIDDLPPEGIPYITDKIMDSGAKNVHIINALTKKGRMEYIVLVDFEEEYFDDISSLLALEFGTIGMKIFKHEHKRFPYELIEKKVLISINDSSLESVAKIKYLFSDDNKLISLKAEYEDLKLLAKDLNQKGYDISFSKLKTIIEAEAYKNPIDSESILISL
ncbi:nickel insertion protein [uncultured Methanobrevibacter sp.]|uniref:nickel insertion protein n=1 Tax=uncultured Methanobrevibacter sp. TaxID=253161 RepID=UPI00262A798B|nr:nickel insertion protein [uncultured Methanobrevibacter sp.]